MSKNNNGKGQNGSTNSVLNTILQNFISQNGSGTLGTVQNTVGNTLQNATGTLGTVQDTIGNTAQNVTGTLGTVQNTLNMLSLMSITSSLETILSQLQNNKKQQGSKNNQKNESSDNQKNESENNKKKEDTNDTSNENQKDNSNAGMNMNHVMKYKSFMEKKSK